MVTTRYDVASSASPMTLGNMREMNAHPGGWRCWVGLSVPVINVFVPIINAFAPVIND
jgi:hypothetical protein